MLLGITELKNIKKNKLDISWKFNEWFSRSPICVRNAFNVNYLVGVRAIFLMFRKCFSVYSYIAKVVHI